jgi:hypothetical protein
VTADCAFMTLDGWRRLADLEVGDRLAVPRRVLEPFRTQCIADDEIVLLAHMIGDGSCVRNRPIRYASIDEQSLASVTKAAMHFGVTAKRDDYPAARVTTLRLLEKSCQAAKIDLMFWNACSPSGPSCRPMPEFLIPPNGALTSGR